MEEQEKPSFYAIIPATVRYDSELNANEKLLYGEITTLCQAKGICWASNSYFAKLYNVTPQAISKWINHLDKKGYINIDMVYKPDSKEVDKRLIILPEVSTQDLGGYQHTIKGYQHRIKDNNNILNNNKKSISTNVDIPKEKEFSFDRHTNKENLDYLFNTNDKLKNLKPDFKQALIDWCEYKDERKPKKNNHYSEKGLKMLLNRVVEYAIKYGTANVINQINRAISETWQGMNLDMLDKGANGNGRY